MIFPQLKLDTKNIPEEQETSINIFSVEADLTDLQVVQERRPMSAQQSAVRKLRLLPRGPVTTEII